MDQSPLPCSNDTPVSIERIYRDVAADIARRRDARSRGETSPAAADDGKISDVNRWRSLALYYQRQLDQIHEWLYEGVRQSGGYPLPRFLANIQTKEEFKQFVLDLILPDLIDTIEAVMEEKARDHEQHPREDTQNPASQEDGQSETGSGLGDAYEGPEPGPGAEDEDVPS